MRTLTKFGPLALAAATVGLVATSWHTGSNEGRALEPSIAEVGGEVSLTNLLVDFRDDVSQEALAANPWREEPISRFSTHDRLYRVRFATAADAQAAKARLRSDPSVEAVDWDAQATLPPHETMSASDAASFTECAVRGDGEAEFRQFPDDPCYRYQWHLSQIGLPRAWKLGQGEGVVVAVIDTGVTKVPDLEGIEFVPGYNFVADNDNAADDHGHGTHVAGTIAQATHNKLGVSGVAFRAKIMPLKVLSASGSGSMAAISQAIRFAADNGAHVINMSLGGSLPVSPIKSAVEYAHKRGVVVVAAAGNNGGRVSYPAKYPGVIAVAATQYDETTTFYSNYGKEVDVAAPGGNVRVDQNGDGKPDGVLQNTVVPGNITKTDYLLFMGTSMAAPHVAGVAALLVGAGVKSPAAVEALLKETARRPKGLREDVRPDKNGRLNDRYGAGIIDADASLKKAVVGGGASRVALAFSLLLLGVSGLRRRGGLGALNAGLPTGALIGAGGLFFLPALVGWPQALSFLTVGAPEIVPTLTGWGAGNPLLQSAALPLMAAGLLYGVARLRSFVAGFAFGVAGALAFNALALFVPVSFVPDAFDRLWLSVHAALAYILGVAALRR